MSSALHVVRAGAGPRLVLIHGSATDHTTWSIQLASRALRERFTLIAYDRRAGERSVEDHAGDAATLVDRETIVVGSSFGAVIALELARTHACRGAVLIEPPMGPSDDAPAAPVAFLAEYDRRLAEQGGPAAAELFLRTVLGDAAYERMPRAYQDRAKQQWAQIRADSAALIAYRPRYAELATLALPVLLVGGERSAPVFRPTLDALQAVLPDARRETVPAAGHMLHAEGHRRFGELVTGFADALASR
ncbi:MAG TPA: alpha/beta fold hydrolase [Kofleriaceae bacterium]|nr:alpha/beta fold hydrolase [Kofleriaceae bacterium]